MTMNAKQACKVLGINRAQWELRNMALALSLHSWLNTPEENERREAAQWAVRHRRAYHAESQKQRDARSHITKG